MNIRPLESLTKEGLIELNASVRDELESLRLQLAEANKTIERREAVIKLLERDIEQIGAGGVPLMGDAKDSDIETLRNHNALLRASVAQAELENERLREALQGLLNALPSATTHPAIKAARAALAQEGS